MNKEEWFELFDNNIDNIRSLTEKYHPWYRNQHDMLITAPRAEAIRVGVVDQISKKKIGPDLSLRSGKYLHKILSEVWWGMPESASVRSEPGFGVLCDLCSEYEGEFEDEIEA